MTRGTRRTSDSRVVTREAGDEIEVGGTPGHHARLTSIRSCAPHVRIAVAFGFPARLNADMRGGAACRGVRTTDHFPLSGLVGNLGWDGWGEVLAERWDAHQPGAARARHRDSGDDRAPLREAEGVAP